MMKSVLFPTREMIDDLDQHLREYKFQYLKTEQAERKYDTVDDL